jgi:hypothetical protein
LGIAEVYGAAFSNVCLENPLLLLPLNEPGVIEPAAQVCEIHNPGTATAAIAGEPF